MTSVQDVKERAVATDNLTERMRERMPAHQVWREPAATAGVSRPASEALWNDLRERMQSYHEARKRTRRGVFIVRFIRRLIFRFINK